MLPTFILGNSGHESVRVDADGASINTEKRYNN
jgi:hypothetical protein